MAKKILILGPARVITESEIKEEVANDIYDEIEFLKRHIETMSLEEINDHYHHIDDMCAMYRSEFGYDGIVKSWDEYDRPYVNMFVSGIRVYPTI